MLFFFSVFLVFFLFVCVFLLFFFCLGAGGFFKWLLGVFEGFLDGFEHAVEVSRKF